MNVSAILVNYRRADLTALAVESLLQQTTVPEIIVVDNAPLDTSCREVVGRVAPRARVIESKENLGFARACNLGARESAGDFLLFFNNDARADARLVENLLRTFTEEPNVGVAGATVLDMDAPRRVQSYASTLDMWGFPTDPMIGRDVDDLPATYTEAFYIPGCALMIDRALFNSLGGFDPGMFMFCEDVDLCWRTLLQGRRVVASPHARCWHQGGATAAVGQTGDGVYETSTERIRLREQHAMRMMVVNLGWAALIRYALLATPSWIAETLVALMLGKPAIANAYVLAVRGFFRTLPDTIQRRGRVQGARLAPDRSVLRLWSHRYEKLHFLFRVGLPRVRGFVRT